MFKEEEVIHVYFFTPINAWTFQLQGVSGSYSIYFREIPALNRPSIASS